MKYTFLNFLPQVYITLRYLLTPIGQGLPKTYSSASTVHVFLLWHNFIISSAATCDWHAKIEKQLKKVQFRNSNQEAHGPRLSHLSNIATADMHLLCYIFLNSVIATNERIIIIAVLDFKKNNVSFTLSSSSNYYCLVEGLANVF